MILFIDTETTGKYNFKLPANHSSQPDIVQLAAIVTDDEGAEAAKMCTLIRPDGWTIEPEAQAIHGISVEMCEVAGIPLVLATAVLAQFVRNCSLVVAHNIDFDGAVVAGCCVRSMLADPLAGIPRYCTMKSATDVLKLPGRYSNYKWPTLVETHRHFFGTELDGAHDALVDVIGCMKCYFALNRSEQPVPTAEPTAKSLFADDGPKHSFTR